MNHFRVCMVWSVLALLIAGCGMDKDRKIKLASEEARQETGVRTAASVLQVSPEEQRSIAILNFENKTGDPTLDWLRRGLTDMLVAELGQSPYLNIVPMKRLSDIAQRLGKATADIGDLAVAQGVAREAQVEMILTGQFYRDGADLRIDSDLRDVGTGQILRRATVRGPGLERIFAMVDELSEELRTNLRGDLAVAQFADVDLPDMTHSVEAFRCYSEALENLDKFRYVDAEDCLHQAIDHDSTFAAAYLRLVMFKTNMGDRDAADQALQQARRYADKLSEPDGIMLRLFEARNIDDVTESIAAMKELLKFSPYDVDTRMSLANLLHRIGDNDGAIEEYNTVLELDPDRKLAYNQLGYLYARRGDFTTAIKYLEKYQQLAPDEHNPYDSMGEVLMWAGRLEEATDYLKTALTKMPTFYQSAMRLTEIYSELGDFEQALAYSKKAMASAPNDHLKSIFYGQRAHLYMRFGRIKQAKEAIARAMESAPYISSHALRAAEMYRAIGDADGARRVTRSLLDRYKEAAEKEKLDAYALQFLFEADLPPVEVSQIAERLMETDCGDLHRQNCLVFSGVAYLRAGEYEKAERSFEEFWEIYEVPPKGSGGGWGSGLKYAVEAIQLAPEQDSLDYDAAKKMFEACTKAGRKDFEFIARLLRAQYHGKYGRSDKLAAEYRDLGFPLEDDWRIVGPFENRSGFHRQFPPEESIDLASTYRGIDDEVRWQPASDGAYDGYVNLREVLNRSQWVVGYGVIYVNSPEKRVVQLRVGTDETSKLWLNDELVWQTYRKRDARLDEHMITVALRPGDNKLLIKVVNAGGEWGYYLRITDENGEGYPDLQFHPPTGEKEELAIR